MREREKNKRPHTEGGGGRAISKLKEKVLINF